MTAANFADDSVAYEAVSNTDGREAEKKETEKICQANSDVV